MLDNSGGRFNSCPEAAVLISDFTMSIIKYLNKFVDLFNGIPPSLASHTSSVRLRPRIPWSYSVLADLQTLHVRETQKSSRKYDLCDHFSINNMQFNLILWNYPQKLRDLKILNVIPGICIAHILGVKDMKWQRHRIQHIIVYIYTLYANFEYAVTCIQFWRPSCKHQQQQQKNRQTVGCAAFIKF